MMWKAQRKHGSENYSRNGQFSSFPAGFRCPFFVQRVFIFRTHLIEIQSCNCPSTRIPLFQTIMIGKRPQNPVIDPAYAMKQGSAVGAREVSPALQCWEEAPDNVRSPKGAARIGQPGHAFLSATGPNECLGLEAILQATKDKIVTH